MHLASSSVPPAIVHYLSCIEQALRLLSGTVHGRSAEATPGRFRGKPARDHLFIREASGRSGRSNGSQGGRPISGGRPAQS